MNRLNIRLFIVKPKKLIISIKWQQYWQTMVLMAFGSIMIGTAQTVFAVHIDGISDFKSQLKDAVSYTQKYRAKKLYIAFFELSNLYIDAHNFVLHKWKMIFQTRRSWKKAHISKPKLPKDLEKFLSLIKFLKQTRLFLPCFHYIGPSLCFFTRCQKHRDVYSFVLQPLKII